MGFAAWLCDAGILLYHFYTITPLASIWTVLVFPLVSTILTLGFLKMILFFVLPTLSAALAVVTALLSDLLVWVVKLIAELDISQILIGQVPLVLVVLYYCVVVFAGFAYLRRPLTKKVIVIATLLAVVAYLGVLKWQRTHRDNLVITCLDVGHGQAILAQLPGRANVLFDAGSLHRSDIGTRIVAPFLDWKGINRIDAIIISHNDTDHINGIPEVAGHCKLGAVYANDDFFDKADEWGTAKFLSDSLGQMGFKIERLDKTVAFSSEANIQTLWPDNQTSYNDQLSDNDKSLVSLIEFAGTRVLLCSDIEQFAQRELLRLHPDLEADIVVVPHHGSANTLEPEFLQKLGAKVHIYSCGRSEYERTDRAPGLVTRDPNRTSFYTHKHGAITVRVNKNGMIRSEACGKQSSSPD